MRVTRVWPKTINKNAGDVWLGKTIKKLLQVTGSWRKNNLEKNKKMRVTRWAGGREDSEYDWF
jgi:hypothetical protein